MVLRSRHSEYQGTVSPPVSSSFGPKFGCWGRNPGSPVPDTVESPPSSGDVVVLLTPVSEYDRRTPDEPTVNKEN